MIRAVAAVLLACVATAARAAEAPAPVGAKAEFTLAEAATGRLWPLAERTRDAKGTVIAFLAGGCQASTAYGPRLAELHKKYSALGVTFVAVYCHPADDAAGAAKHAKELSLPFPALIDDETHVAEKLAVTRVPSVIVLDTSRAARYAGRIDDQFGPGLHRPAATTHELADAIDDVLAGHEVKVSSAPATGCLVTRSRTAKPGEPAVTYYKDVVAILQTRCQECHRAGEAGPFALTSFKQTRNWADMIREVVAGGTMPPWSSDAPPGHFKNDRRLTPAEKATLLAWVDAGCPEGNAVDAPPVPKFVTGWRFGREPDEVLKMAEPIKIPAQSPFGWGLPYQYVPVGKPFAEDKWVTGVEVRPGYRAAVHHIIAFVLPPGANIWDIAGKEFGKHMLGAFVPGDQPIIAPPGGARKLEKGSRILFEVHYTPNGTPGDDQSMVGLIYAKEPPERELHNWAIFNGRFQIPPGAADHEVQSVYKFPKPADVILMTPHMHLRGKSFKYELVTTGPDGGEKREVLLNVPKYDFNWQVSYVFKEPRRVPAGAKIVCTAHFDNSAQNPVNPDPTKLVRWGNQTWDEMMIGFVMYADVKE
ncbi:redoxin domain-containing protein [Fimbriiglobus ruber]|uniref:Thiol-disulfide oxidoreductase n=1 Tax=Fimbriiglobus ruber TaxID=1908690 RepID=A0A225EDJ2_9BACT|nr:redoxin domain-containing protein [Fimbriiglobus ruber]OWK46495.1 Thiol-disulfide oxidoreductase [Fimbriiglobus ruber]